MHPRRSRETIFTSKAICIARVPFPLTADGAAEPPGAVITEVCFTRTGVVPELEATFRSGTFTFSAGVVPVLEGTRMTSYGLTGVAKMVA